MRRTCSLAAHGVQAPDLILMIILALTFSSCGGNGGPTSQQGDAQVSGNWQFAMSTTGDSFVVSPLQGGFLLQKNGAITGQIVFSIELPPPSAGASPVFCNSGTAAVTGTISSQTVSLNAAIAALDSNGNPTTQTLTLSGGALSSDGTAIQNGTYRLTAGYGVSQGQNVACGGVPQDDAGTWSATLVPPLTGGFQGFFHSTESDSRFINQNFPVSGIVTQGPNIGAASATVTGTLVFQDPVSLLNDYPCLSTASVNGTISGSNVLLQIFSTSGTLVGQIGQAPETLAATPTISPTAVTLDSAKGGYVVHNSATSGMSGYVIKTTKSCSNGDSGNLCLALGNSKVCNQPVLLTPLSLTFPPQLVGSAATSQTITLNNTSALALSGTLGFTEIDSGQFYTFGGGDFNGVRSFNEQDNCTQPGSNSISLEAGASCTVTVLFSPQESCPWLPQTTPTAAGVAPAQCPSTLTASLAITVPSGSADADNEFSVPITGTGLSAIIPSVPEIDFGAEALGEASPPHILTFTNQSSKPVTILPAMPVPCVYKFGAADPPIPRPPISNGEPVISGLQLAETAVIGLNNSAPIATSIQLIQSPVPPTVGYFCEIDPPVSKQGSGLPNFQLSQDECSGQTLVPFGQPGNSCSLEITFVPQPKTWTVDMSGNDIGLDDFLQLNTMWCGDSNDPPEPNCEIDSGRFPVEIKTNPPSPLRMSPSAGMDFGTVTRGTASPPLTITLFNDPVDPKAGTVTIASKLVTGADYIESDTCPAALASNQSCAVTVAFTPTIVGLDPGIITLTYNTATEFGLTQLIYLRGTGQ